MVDRNRSLKLEDSVGGSSTDMTPTETAPNSDGLDARAYFAQNDTSADSAVYLSRTGANLTLTDAVAGTKNAVDLVSRVLGATSAHASLLDIQHLLGDEGPGDGWASGANMRTVYSGPLLTSRTWYASSSASAAPIVRYAVTYKTGTPLAATQTWTLYTISGAVYRQVVDTLTWAGPQLAGVVRTWA